jgi:hypothetical protein
VHPRVGKLLAQDFVLDVVEGKAGSVEGDERNVPGRLGSRPFDVVDAFERVMPGNQLHRVGIVGVEPVSQLLIAAPVFFLRRVGGQLA